MLSFKARKRTMENIQIVQKLAQNKVLETIISNITKGSTDEDLKDLTQDLYESLLTKDPTVMSALYESNELNFYLTRMVVQNVNSKTSPYYYNYKLYKLKSKSIDESETQNYQEGIESFDE